MENSETVKSGDLPSGKSGNAQGLITTKIPATELGSGIIPVMIKEVGSAPDGKTPKSESNISLKNNDSSIFSPTTWRFIEILFAELLGTGGLMFFGCMGLLSVNGSVHPAQGGAVFGLVVCTLIQIFGHISSAHFNPVVTLTAIVLGKITPITALVYFVAEFVGAILGVGLLKIVTPCELWDLSGGNSTGVCSTIPIKSLTDSQSLAIEFLATSFLILVVCSVWDARNADKPDSVPLKFAVTITVISVIAGPLTGASMNPARSVAPAVFSGVWTKHWIYWVGPMSAGFFTSVFYQLVFDRKKQSESEFAEDVPLTSVTAVDGKSSQSILLSNSMINDKQTNESQPQSD